MGLKECKPLKKKSDKLIKYLYAIHASLLMPEIHVYTNTSERTVGFVQNRDGFSGRVKVT